MLSTYTLLHAPTLHKLCVTHYPLKNCDFDSASSEIEFHLNKQRAKNKKLTEYFQLSRALSLLLITSEPLKCSNRLQYTQAEIFLFVFYLRPLRAFLQGRMFFIYELLLHHSFYFKLIDERVHICVRFLSQF